MAFIKLGTPSNFGSDHAPNIGLIFEYEKQRSGANMQYRLRITIKPVSGGSTFGFNITCVPTIAGSVKSKITLKGNSPTQWSSNIVYTTGWYTVSNKTSGTTSVSFTMDSNASDRSQTFSYSMAIDPAASSFSVSNGTLGTTQTITVAKNNSAFTSTITYKCGSVTGTICNKSENTSISWTPPTSLANQNTTGTSLSCTLTFQTYSGASLVGTSTKTINLSIPASIKPTVSLSVTDGTSYFDTFGAYIQTRSTIKVTISASGAGGSTIKSYSTSANGGIYTNSSFTTSVIYSSGALTITATVTDSRGRTASDSKTITVLAYKPPTTSIASVIRTDASGNPNNSGAYLKVTFSAVVSSLNNKNTKSYQLLYKKSSTASYTTVALSLYSGSYTVTNGTHVFAADTDSSYDIIIKANDYFTSSSVPGQGVAITKLASILPENRGIAFGKIAELDNTFDVGWNARFRGRYQFDDYMDGQIKSDKAGTSWINGRANAVIRRTVGSASAFQATVSLKTPAGSWDVGTLGENFYFSYATDANYNAGINSTKLPYIGNDGKFYGTAIYADSANSVVSGNSTLLYKDSSGAANMPLGLCIPNEGSTAEPMNRIMGTYSDGTKGLIASISSGNNIVFGYGSYKDKKGRTNIYTNDYLRISTATYSFASISGRHLTFNYPYSSASMVIACNWADSKVHDIVMRAADGLNSYIGPGDITTNGRLNTTTNIRGRNVRLYNHRGGGVFLGASGSTAITSDKNLKKDIVDLDTKYEHFFNDLRPVTYKYNTKSVTGHRDHVGYIAQEVEQALINSGLSTENFAGVVIEHEVTLNPNYDGEKTAEENKDNEEYYDKLYSLRYEEFIALNTYMIQKQQSEIDFLKQEIINLKHDLIN